MVVIMISAEDTHSRNALSLNRGWENAAKEMSVQRIVTFGNWVRRVVVRDLVRSFRVRFIMRAVVRDG